MSEQDKLLEAQIDIAWQAMCSAGYADLARACFERLREKVAQRSPEQIERMEREQGLRP